MSMKNSSDTIGNRTRDLPACSAVPQTTASPRTKWDVVYLKTSMSVINQIRTFVCQTVVLQGEQGWTLLQSNIAQSLRSRTGNTRFKNEYLISLCYTEYTCMYIACCNCIICKKSHFYIFSA